jgi:hypothetical protein
MAIALLLLLMIMILMAVAMLLLIIFIMPIPVTVSLHLLHLHEKAASAAARRRNCHMISVVLHFALLLLHQLRGRSKGRGAATQPLAHAQPPQITVHDKVSHYIAAGNNWDCRWACTLLLPSEQTLGFLSHAKFRPLVGADGGPEGEKQGMKMRGGGWGREGQLDEAFDCEGCCSTSSTFSRSFSRFLVSIWRRCHGRQAKKMRAPRDAVKASLTFCITIW